MNTITGIDLYFKNTESAHIDAKDIGKFHITGIRDMICRISPDEITDTRTFDEELFMELLPRANAAYRDLSGKPCRLFDRLNTSRDIARIVLDYEDGTASTIVPPWKEPAVQHEQSENMHQFAKLEKNSGKMFLFIRT